MIYKFFLFLFFSSFLSPMIFAQEDENYFIKDDFKRSLGLEVSYDQFNHDYTSFAFSDRTNFSVGLNMKNVIKEKLDYSIGLWYSVKGYSFEFLSFPDFIPVEYLIWANYIELNSSIGYRYRLGKKFVFVPGIGLIASFLAGKSVTSPDTDVTEEFEESLTSTLANALLALNVEISAEYHLNSRWFLTATPYYRQWFQNLDERAINSNSTSYGLSFGLHRKF